MKQFILHIAVILVFYIYGITVSETLLDHKSNGPGTPLDSQIGDSGTGLGKHSHDPDANRNVSELITSKGFTVEEHTVQTDDGYLLTLLRIPHGRNGSREKEDKKVVLLIHGDLSDAVQWVLDFPNQSLGFILPDKGYDTWLLNNRGCKYSKKHIEFKTHEYRFWNFSFQELGQYDAPATIDYILEETNKDELYIVGHSRGTSQIFSMLSEMPDYNDKVKLFIAMAPATFLGHMTSPVRALVPIADEIALTINLATGGEFLPGNQISKKLREKFCAVVAPDLCENLIFAIGGEDKAQLNETRLGVYAAHFPSTTSIKSLLHYAQEEPPDYNLSSITTPLALFWSSNDKLVDPRDVDLLRRELKTVVFDYHDPYPHNHFDYAIAKNAPKFLYKPVLKLLAEK